MPISGGCMAMPISGGCKGMPMSEGCMGMPISGGCILGCIKFFKMKEEYGICPGHISALQKWTQNLFLTVPQFTQFNYVSKLI